jgi:hypothetical protein
MLSVTLGVAVNREATEPRVAVNTEATEQRVAVDREATEPTLG